MRRRPTTEPRPKECQPGTQSDDKWKEPATSKKRRTRKRKTSTGEAPTTTQEKERGRQGRGHRREKSKESRAPECKGKRTKDASGVDVNDSNTGNPGAEKIDVGEKPTPASRRSARNQQQARGPRGVPTQTKKQQRSSNTRSSTASANHDTSEGKEERTKRASEDAPVAHRVRSRQSAARKVPRRGGSAPSSRGQRRQPVQRSRGTQTTRQPLADPQANPAATTHKKTKPGPHSTARKTDRHQTRPAARSQGPPQPGTDAARHATDQPDEKEKPTEYSNGMRRGQHNKRDRTHARNDTRTGARHDEGCRSTQRKTRRRNRDMNRSPNRPQRGKNRQEQQTRHA
ncbi:hypothetical protein Tco_1165304 [Tanacetum coccineum]